MSNNDCDNRPVIVETKEDGAWKSLAYNGDGSPHVFECIHVAQVALMRAFAGAYAAGSAGIAPFEKMPNLSDFRFTYVDKEPENLDAPVISTELADNVLNKFLGGSRQ